LPSKSGYAVRVTERRGRFRLEIVELSLVAEAPEIGEAHALLKGRLDALLSWAKETGLTDAIPAPAPTPSVRSATSWQESRSDFGLTIELSERPIVSKIMPSEAGIEATHSR
jgi:hypothetical protein